MSTYKRFCRVIILQLCVTDFPGSNFGQEYNAPTDVFRGFPLFLQAVSVIVL